MTDDEAYADWRERLIQARVEEQLSHRGGTPMDIEIASMAFVTVATEKGPSLDRFLGDPVDAKVIEIEINRRLADALNKDANQ